MAVCVQRVIVYLLSLFIVGTTCQYLRTNAAFGVRMIRERRQAGYVYDRPTISFNLPSRASVGSVSTQATNVDRTSAQQMYYAYPAPAGGGAINTGYSNAGSSATTSTVTSGAAGYNYNNAIQNTASGSTGGTTSALTTGSGSNGYSYNVGAQNTESVSTGGITTVTTQTVEEVGGSGGYRYSGIVQNTGSGTAGGSTSTITTGSESGSSGYRYDGGTQNTVTGSTGTINTATAGGGTASAGYSYDTQTVGNRGVQTVTSSVSNLYNAPSTGGTTAVVIDNLSTNAPEYLPPNSAGGNAGVGVTTSSQSGSTASTFATPSDTYLPPVQGVTSATVQTTGNVPSLSVITQTSGAPLPVPSTNYLQPNTQQQISNVQTTQVRGQTGGSVQVVPTSDYIPPIVNSGMQISVSTPAATYLPPVF